MPATPRGAWQFEASSRAAKALIPALQALNDRGDPTQGVAQVWGLRPLGAIGVNLSQFQKSVATGMSPLQGSKTIAAPFPGLRPSL